MIPVITQNIDTVSSYAILLKTLIMLTEPEA